MTDKETKVPIYIAIIVALILVAAAGYFFLGGTKLIPPTSPGQTPGITTTETPKETPGMTATTTPSVTTTAPVAAPPATVKCELCHTNPQDLSPHVNGGKLCINCHGSQVHNIHIGPGTVNLNCDTCHGFPPTIPTVAKGEGPGHYSVCENCHAAPPDNLKPSNGNLIVIHLSRGKYCTNCHGTDITAIHAGAIANATKP